MSDLKTTLAAIQGLDTAALRAAERRQQRLTKPPGSLGALERTAIRLAGITRREQPRFDRRVVVVAAASHGVADAEGVSAYPAAVTSQMVANFVAGGAAINALAEAAGAELIVVDAGVVPEPPPHPTLRRCRLGPGSRNLRRERALPEGHGRRSVEAGVALVEELDAGEPWLLAIGEMGIGNTTASAAIIAAACGADVDRVTGRGTLIDDARLSLKREVVRAALALHRPDPGNGLDLLESVGGYEIGFLAGCCLGAAARRVPIVLDGIITAAAALVAAALAPDSRDAMIAGHRSAEPGHRVALDALGLEPLLDLDLRLGEGSGAALALPLVAAAARAHAQMATFDEAGVDGRN